MIASLMWFLLFSPSHISSSLEFRARGLISFSLIIFLKVRIISGSVMHFLLQYLMGDFIFLTDAGVDLCFQVISA